MEEKRNNWALLVKPTEECNLNCEYCYAKPFRDKYKNKKMSFDIVDKILKLSEDYAKNVNWVWHGGEPTLMGIDWYKKVQELFYNHYNTKFNQSMQSNGVVLNEQWGKLSLDYDIKIGVSFDVFNQDIRLGSKMVDIEENIKRFISTGATCGTITVINKDNYTKQIDLYEYFKNTFNFYPSFNHVYRSDGTLKYSLEIEAEDYCNEFIKYYRHVMCDTSFNSILERSFILMTNQVIGSRDLVCTFNDCTMEWIGVNCIGDLYPCDRYVPERYSMGNIKNFDSIVSIYNTPGHKLYEYERLKRLNTHCKKCGYKNYCNGGCNANHIAVKGNNCEIDEFSCDLFRINFYNVYNELKNIDVYNVKKYNKKFLEMLLMHPFYSLIEIKEFLYEKGMILQKEKLTTENLLNSIEFNLFRIFNMFKGVGVNNHINFLNIPIIKPNIDFSNMEEIKINRRISMNFIYNENKDAISNLLTRGGIEDEYKR